MTAARIGPAKNIVSRLMFPPIGVCTTIAATAADDVECRRDAEHAVLPRDEHEQQHRDADADEERLGVVREPPARREQAHQHEVRPEARHAEPDAAPQPVGDVVQRPGREGQGQEGAGDRAAEHRRRGQRQRQRVVATPQREQRAESEGEAHREREPPDQQVDERADAEPPRRQPPPGQSDEQPVESPTRDEGADDAGDADAEHGGDRCEEDPVAGDVVTREPLQVEHATELFGEQRCGTPGPGSRCRRTAPRRRPRRARRRPTRRGSRRTRPPGASHELHVVSDVRRRVDVRCCLAPVRTVEPQWHPTYPEPATM